MTKLIDLSGARFGRLLVIKRSGTWVGPSGSSVPLWICRCDCGTVKSITGLNLRTGNSTSCGCRVKEMRSSLHRTHGMSRKGKSRAYHIWCGMRYRCNSPDCPLYKYYGGRGITICKRWEDFVLFAQDMGDIPSPKHTLERKDNNGPYSPENCVWATMKEQSRNQRRNLMYQIDGETKCLMEWCEIYGVEYNITRNRLKKSGWNIIDALTRPLQKNQFGALAIVNSLPKAFLS